MLFIHDWKVCAVLCYLIVQICVFDLEQLGTDWVYCILHLVNVVDVLFGGCRVLPEVVGHCYNCVLMEDIVAVAVAVAVGGGGDGDGGKLHALATTPLPNMDIQWAHGHVVYEVCTFRVTEHAHNAF